MRLFLYIFILSIPATNYFSADYEISYPATFKTTNALNIRQKPYITSKKIGVIANNTEIIVDSLHNGQWACITHNGKVAYVATKYITFQNKGTKQDRNYENSQCDFTFSWIVNILLLLIIIRYLCFLSQECLLFYALLFISGGIGYFIIGIFTDCFRGCFIAISLHVVLWLFASMLAHKVLQLLKVISEPFTALNQLQYFLQKPWRQLQKNRNGLFCKIMKMAPEINNTQHKMQRFCYRLFAIWHTIISATLFCLQILLYVISTPLRLTNAVIYNILIHIPCSLYDYIAEVFNPKGEGMRHLEKWEYAYQYCIKFPYRFGKFFLIRGSLTILESFIYTIVDIVIPTLTMYHGTSNNACYKITGDKDVTFKVGSGNYAGNGIYFAISKSTAEHYAQGVIIVSRVSLGRIFNVNIAPKQIRNYVSKKGAELTNWGLQQNIKTFEWWRENGEWWEYCMIQPAGMYKESWRIRPLYIENLRTGFKERIYKGMAHWLFK